MLMMNVLPVSPSGECIEVENLPDSVLQNIGRVSALMAVRSRAVRGAADMICAADKP
jgi:hypothetical protein